MTGSAESDTSSQPGDLREGNRYAYVGDDPVDGVDLQGTSISALGLARGCARGAVESGASDAVIAGEVGAVGLGVGCAGRALGEGVAMATSVAGDGAALVRRSLSEAGTGFGDLVDSVF